LGFRIRYLTPIKVAATGIEINEIKVRQNSRVISPSKVAVIKGIPIKGKMPK
jgi:hypothetical protein